MNIGSLYSPSGTVAVISNALRGSKPPAYWKYPFIDIGLIRFGNILRLDRVRTGILRRLGTLPLANSLSITYRLSVPSAADRSFVAT